MSFLRVVIVRWKWGGTSGQVIWWSREAWLCDPISIRRYLSIKCKSCTVWYFWVDTEHAILTYELCTCLKNTWFICQCIIMKIINRFIFIINEIIYFNCSFFDSSQTKIYMKHVNVTLWNQSYFKLIIETMHVLFGDYWRHLVLNKDEQKCVLQRLSTFPHNDRSICVFEKCFALK